MFSSLSAAAAAAMDGVKMKHFVPAGKDTTHSLCVFQLS